MKLKKMCGLFMGIVMAFSVFNISACSVGDSRNSNVSSSENNGNENNGNENNGNENNGNENSGNENSGNENSGNENSGNENNVLDYVDFVVDVEAGRDIRILQFSDVQTISYDQKRYESRVPSSKEADTFNGYEKFIGQVIERYDPDFIIMTGDNTYGEFDDYGEQHLALIEFMDSFEIPWAPVFGNHDNESNMGVDWQCEQFENSQYCLFKQRELTGNGNYSVGITQAGELKRVFYMLDSNGCGNMSAISFANGHSKKGVGFGEDQIQWYMESMQEVKSVFPSAKLSMAFHIQLAIFQNAFEKYGYDATTISKNPIDLDTIDAAKEEGAFGYIGAKLKNPWDTDYRVWNSIKTLGVDSVFCGHEHYNSASIVYEGVRLQYGQKSSTFDRYNYINGKAIVGGTYMDLSKEDGTISNAGLYLYDQDLGYDNPKQPETNDKIPENAIVTELDFNGEDFNTTITTDVIKNEPNFQKLTDMTNVPIGYNKSVYGVTSGYSAAVGVKFDQTVYTEQILAVYIRMYISEYTISSGKNPLVRIYNDTNNSLLTEFNYFELGGKFNEWVDIDILPLLESSNIAKENILPFTLVLRLYGNSNPKLYMDSITIVSTGDPYVKNESVDDSKVGMERGEEYVRYSLEDLPSLKGTLTSGEKRTVEIQEDKYSISFLFTPKKFDHTFWVCGYANGTDVSNAFKIGLTSSKITITAGKTEAVIEFEMETTYHLEIGFMKLYNGNSVYVFVKIDGQMVVWELLEAYNKADGNTLVFYDLRKTDSFDIS